MAGKKRETLQVERVPFQFQLDKTSEFEAGRFRGIASVFESVVDTYPNRTRIRKGSFLKTINDRASRVKILSAHDQGSIWIGLPTKLQETDEGLLVEASLNNTQLGKDAAEALRHAVALGKLDAVEMSIGFDAINYEMVEGEDEELFRDVTEIRLWEISLVNFGADRKTKMLEAARLDMEAQLLPRHRAEAHALAALHELQSLRELVGPSEGHPQELSATIKQLIEQLREELVRFAEPEAGSSSETPTEENELERLDLELIEAEEKLLELCGAISP